MNYTDIYEDRVKTMGFPSIKSVINAKKKRSYRVLILKNKNILRLTASNNFERLVRFTVKNLGRVIRIVTSKNSGCQCKFKMVDQHGEYVSNRPHSNWNLFWQDHSSKNFRYYLECNGCNYQLAFKYWDFDYSNGQIDEIEKKEVV